MVKWSFSLNKRWSNKAKKWKGNGKGTRPLKWRRGCWGTWLCAADLCGLERAPSGSVAAQQRTTSAHRDTLFAERRQLPLTGDNRENDSFN